MHLCFLLVSSVVWNWWVKGYFKVCVQVPLYLLWGVAAGEGSPTNFTQCVRTLEQSIIFLSSFPNLILKTSSHRLVCRVNSSRNHGAVRLLWRIWSLLFAAFTPYSCEYTSEEMVILSSVGDPCIQNLYNVTFSLKTTGGYPKNKSMYLITHTSPLWRPHLCCRWDGIIHGLKLHLH